MYPGLPLLQIKAKPALCREVLQGDFWEDGEKMKTIYFPGRVPELTVSHSEIIRSETFKGSQMITVIFSFPKHQCNTHNNQTTDESIKEVISSGFMFLPPNVLLKFCCQEQ